MCMELTQENQSWTIIKLLICQNSGIDYIKVSSLRQANIPVCHGLKFTGPSKPIVVGKQEKPDHPVV